MPLQPAWANAPVFVSGQFSKLNITVPTVIKALPGRIAKVIVTTAGTTAGTVSDVATVAGVDAANLVSEIPIVAGPVVLDFPCSVGIVVTPGTGQVLSVSYS